VLRNLFYRSVIYLSVSQRVFSPFRIYSLSVSSDTLISGDALEILILHNNIKNVILDLVGFD
jgi:hypothetical protein